MTELLIAAVGYAREGLPVFPCDPRTKRSLVEHGFKEASTDETAIADWWGRWPNAMIGVPTGGKSGVWVLDIDNPAEFEAACPVVLPETQRCDTHKGYHLYFRHDPAAPVRNAQRHPRTGWPFKSMPGAEVRGEGGYVIVPPSVHPEGTCYQWANQLRAVEPPVGLLEAIARAKGDAPAVPAKRSAVAAPVGDVTAYGLAALRAECDAILSAVSGEQEAAFNDACLKVGGLVKGGEIGAGFARAQLIAAAQGMVSHKPGDPWTPQAIETKVDRSMADGKARTAPDPVAKLRGGSVPGDSELANDNLPLSMFEGVEPVNLWQRYDAPEMPTELLPEVSAKFAKQSAYVMGVDPAGLAMAALAVCSASITDAIAVQVKQYDPGWRESARLWVGLVGSPSMKKSPILSAALRPLKRVDAGLARAYQDQRAALEALPAKERKEVERPRQERRILSDTTVEAAQEILRDSPRGLLSAQDELSGWFGAMDKYAPGKASMADRSFWLQAYNGGTYSYNRIGRGSGYIPNCSVSLLGGIQPEPLRAIANDSHDDGLVQRILPVILRPGGIGHDVPLGDAVTDYERLIEQLEVLQPEMSGGVLSGNGEGYPRPLLFDARARSVREEREALHLDLMRSLEGVSPKLSAHVGKYDGIFARLCVVWHCVENVGGLHVPREISLATTERVSKFMDRFVKPSAVAFYAGVLGLSAGHDDLMALASFIVAKGVDEVKARDVQGSSQSFRHVTAEQVRLLCEQLEAFGWLGRAEPGPKSATTRWLVNPEVHSMFAEQGRKEADRRTKAREALQHALAG
ncbi:MAG: DUF3987 domain-containing protein [Alteraurantiacibacter sp.]